MAILPSTPVQDSVLSDFRGPWLRPNTADVPSSEALQSLNCEYGPHLVGTRFGFGNKWAAGKIFQQLFNWIGGGFDALITMDSSGNVGYTNLLANPLSSFTMYGIPTSEGFRVGRSGSKLYIATFKSSGPGTPFPLGSGPCHIVDGTDLGAAFMGGTSTKPTLTTVGGGSITPGVHSVGYIMVSKSGFMGAPCPISTTTGLFDATSSITVGVNQGIHISLTFTPPLQSAAIYPVLSPITNPYQFIIPPGYTASLSPPGFNTITFTIGGPGSPFLTDQALLAEGQDVTARQYLLTQGVDGGGGNPFQPFCVIEYGSRLVYLTYDALNNCAAYVSNQSDPEYVTESYNKLRLPGVLQITSGFVLRGLLYILGPNWTYAFEDTGNLPATWQSPTLVDGDIGTTCCCGAIVNASNDWAAVASKIGLFIFNGQYQERPLTYMVDSDWRRINWAVAQTIRMTDNKDKKQIVVAVPLDGATVPSHMMVFDYTDGLDYESIKYSLWSISGYSPRSIVMVQNGLTNREELWIGPSDPSQNLLRQMNSEDDLNPYSDWMSGAKRAIPAVWECAPQPDGNIGQIMSHVGGYVRALGNGNLRATAFSLDHAKQAVWANPIALQANPGVEYWRQFYLNAERASIQFSCGSNPDEYFVLSGYRHRYYPWALRR